MVTELELLFESHYSTHRKAINSMPKACCKTTTELAYSFDEIVQEYYATVKLGNYTKSTDILFFHKIKMMIFLAEMTSFVAYAASTGKNTDRDCVEYVRNELLKTELRDKIIHTHFVLEHIVTSLCRDGASCLIPYSKSKIAFKNFLILEMTNEQYVILSLACLDVLEKVRSNRIEGEMTIVNCAAFEQFLQ